MPIDRDCSRRRFLALAGAGTVLPARWLPLVPSQSADRSVGAVMARVMAALPAAAAAGVDGLKAGPATLRVTGIVTTAMATAAVLRQAAVARCNLVVSCEPTYFSRADDARPAGRTDDAVFAAKRDLISRAPVAVWRLRDAWAARQPSPMVAGLAAALGWNGRQDPAAPHRVILEPMRLGDLVTHVQQSLQARALRIVGDPNLMVQRVVLSPGPSVPAATFANLAAADLILAGEAREWEGVEYVQDAITAGMPKAMILVGRVLSEDPGMQQMAAWLPTVAGDLPVRHVPAGDLYWRP